LELSSKWAGLDTNTQRYIATIAAGSRQQSRFIAMMSDYGRTQDLVAAANNSAGASNKQFEKTLESMDAKLNNLKNAWNEFTLGIMNSELLKTGVDILTTFLNIINKVTAGFGQWTGMFSKAGMLIAVFKTGEVLVNKLFTSLNTKIENLGNTIGTSIANGVKAGLGQAEADVEATKAKVAS
jgi:TP901 family phage tail tape measure protein